MLSRDTSMHPYQPAIHPRHAEAEQNKARGHRGQVSVVGACSSLPGTRRRGEVPTRKEQTVRLSSPHRQSWC